MKCTAKRSGNQTWRCENRSCSAKVVTSGTDGKLLIDRSNLTHNHDIARPTKALTFKHASPSCKKSHDETELTLDVSENSKEDIGEQEQIRRTREILKKKMKILREMDRKERLRLEKEFKPIIKPLKKAIRTKQSLLPESESSSDDDDNRTVEEDEQIEKEEKEYEEETDNDNIDGTDEVNDDKKVLDSDVDSPVLDTLFVKKRKTTQKKDNGTNMNKKKQQVQKKREKKKQQEKKKQSRETEEDAYWRSLFYTDHHVPNISEVIREAKKEVIAFPDRFNEKIFSLAPLMFHYKKNMGLLKFILRSKMMQDFKFP